MKVQLKGSNIQLSESSIRDIPFGIMLILKETEDMIPHSNIVYTDVVMGKKEYPLPNDLVASDVLRVYLRVL